MSATTPLATTPTLYQDLARAIVAGEDTRNWLAGRSAAERMALWRVARGISQEEAAASLGVTQSAWAKWEEGLRRPSPHNRMNIEALTEGFVGEATWSAHCLH